MEPHQRGKSVVMTRPADSDWLEHFRCGSADVRASRASGIWRRLVRPAIESDATPAPQPPRTVATGSQPDKVSRGVRSRPAFTGQRCVFVGSPGSQIGCSRPVAVCDGVDRGARRGAIWAPRLVASWMSSQVPTLAEESFGGQRLSLFNLLAQPVSTAKCVTYMEASLVREPTPWEDWTAFRSPDSGDLGFARSCSSRVLNSFETKRFLSCGGRVVSYHSVPPRRRISTRAALLTRDPAGEPPAARGRLEVDCGLHPRCARLGSGSSFCAPDREPPGACAGKGLDR